MVVDNVVDVVLGMGVIDRLGGVLVSRFKVEFGVHFGGQCLPVLAATQTGPVLESCKKEVEERCFIEEKDFRADFNGKHWTVEWVWKSGQNKISCYDQQMTGSKKEELELD